MSMKVTKILMEEHQVILSKLNKLEVLLTNSNESILEQIEYYFDFIKYYSDEYHHAKEENIYFQWMIAKNPSVEFGPIRCMLSEHAVFRTLVEKAKSAILDYRENQNDIDMESAKNNLTEFISGLRMHIDKEDNVLYRMADNMNNSDGDELMYEKFMSSNKALAENIANLGSLHT